MTAPDDLAREEPTYRAYNEGFDRMVGVHEPECIGLNRDDDLAGQCDCRTIRMLVIGVLQERLASVVSRRDTDLRTRIEALRDEWATAGPGTETDRVFGRQVVSVEYAVAALARALVGDTREGTPNCLCGHDKAAHLDDRHDWTSCECGCLGYQPSRVPADTDTGRGQ